MSAPDASPRIALTHLDHLWLQITGTRCNIACAHCFNHSGPHAHRFGDLGADAARTSIDEAAGGGVREIFFTGGEPFLHPRLLELVEYALTHAPTTILTNGMLISDRIADRLAAIEAHARYSLEIRVSLDGFTEAANDAIRGRGVFRLALAALTRLSAHDLLPIVTIVRTWPDEEELATLAGFTRMLRDAGCPRVRIKVLPALPLGRELERTPGLMRDEHVSEAMLDGFDRDLLMCTNSRLVTDHGVWVCPLLVDEPEARLGATLAEADRSFAIGHHACVSCWRYGTICGNVSAEIEGVSSSDRP
jgi:MoaA/NifB/PqqE/SkfB family radical SAM enzyme